VTTLGVNFYRTIIYPATPLTRAAAERASIASDLEAALRINPQTLKSRIEVANQIQYLEDRVGEQHSLVLASIRNRLEAGQISHAQAWEETKIVLEAEVGWRIESQKAVQRLTGKPPKETSSSNGLPWQLALFGGILFGISLIPKSFTGKSLAAWIGAVSLMAALALGVFSWLQPAAKSATAKINGLTPAKPALQEIPVGITLQSGEKIIFTKPTGAAPPIVKYVYNDGEEKEFNQVRRPYWPLEVESWALKNDNPEGRSFTVVSLAAKNPKVFGFQKIAATTTRQMAETVYVLSQSGETKDHRKADREDEVPPMED
jgi:hypothetical protein